MILWGTMVNAAAIVAGTLLGLLLPKLSQGMKSTIIQGIGITICVLGLMMALKSSNFLIVVSSLVVGGVLGEIMKVEDGLKKLGAWLEKTVKGKSEGKIAEAFVTASLVFCVGAMAILGALDSGLRNDHNILYTKSMLDGFLAIIFTSTLGVGVLFSSITVFMYQGSIVLASSLITIWFSETALNAMITDITSVGGILIIGIGLNILEIKRVNVANLLPSILVAALAAPMMAWIAKLGL
jgi:uncharacterized membrane protein YqgA involved in biofilm formation